MTGGGEEFEVQLGRAFGQAGGGPGPEVTARLMDGGLAIGRRRRRARRRRALAAGALAAVVVIGAGALTVPHGVPGVRSNAIELANSGSPSASSQKDVTILLVGLQSSFDAQGRPVPDDLLYGDLHAQRFGEDIPDTLMLVRIPADGSEVRQLSIPRDLRAPDGHSWAGQLNSVYAKAESDEIGRLHEHGLAHEDMIQRGREAGRVALIKAVEQLAQLPVDHYAEISMTGFYRAAQALGGVPVCLNRAAKDKWSGIDLPAGRQELGPAQALAFVRQRHGIGDGSDVGRTRRAQAFLAGVLAKLRTGGVLTDPAKLAALYGSFADQLVTDAGWSPVDFVRQVPALAAGRGTSATLPVRGEGSSVTTDPGLAHQFLLDSEAAATAKPGLAEAKEADRQALEAAGGVPCVD
ncbi:LCP family protein [Kitasatospora sp. NPDC092948]|uniref:LCP family protein n=1 Tax=Kitasatospora sp. NPDC092948 TaxID=3364088 RepID=UPI0037F4E128